MSCCCCHTMQGEDPLQYWKNHINIGQVLDGKQDLRSVTGLKRAVTRRMASKTVEGTLLNNFLKLVQACVQLGPNLLATVCDAELFKTIEQLEQEDIALTRGFQERLLLRRVAQLVAEHKFAEVIDCLNPWARLAFDWKRPTLAGIHDEQGSSKLNTFKSVLFNEVFCKLILEGQPKGDTVKALSQQCLSIVDSVDLVAMDSAAAKTLSECETVWKALWALLTPTLDIALQHLHLHEGVFSNTSKH
eukprot:6492445-Amphidinium_carterae.5